MNDEVKAIVSAGYAEHVRDVVLSKQLLEHEIEILKSQLLPKGVAPGEKLTIQPTNDAIPKGVIKLNEMIEEYETKQAEYADNVYEMHNALLNIEVIARRALTEHYLHLETWEQICVTMSYSYQGIMRIRKRGLIQLYDFIPGEFRAVLPKAIQDRDLALPGEVDL